MTAPVPALTALRVAARAALARALSAAVWCALLALAGLCLIVAGVYLLGGLPWALMTGGVMALVLAALLLIGMQRA